MLRVRVKNINIHLMRKYTPFDQLIMNADTALRTLFGQPVTTHREYPAESRSDSEMSDPEFSEQTIEEELLGWQ